VIKTSWEGKSDAGGAGRGETVGQPCGRRQETRAELKLAYWSARVGLALLPLILALAAYYPKQLAGAPLPPPHGDAALYAYQLMHAAEHGGRWWRVGDDLRLGNPYPTELAKHPGLYEGVDLMLLASLTRDALGATLTYHLAVLIALALNGWVAAWIVLRLTRSTLWAGVAATLITLNQPVAARILGHLHLFKFAWSLLAVWAFIRFLDQPDRRRGFVLGLAVALVLQSSFYLGFFMFLGLGSVYLLALAAGRLKAGNVGATVVAALACAAASAALCFPVWTQSLPIATGGQYFQRDWFETWNYGSELWQYVVPRTSSLAHSFYRDVRLRPTPPLLDEGWNFPGFTIVLAVVIAGVSRLRGPKLFERVGSWAPVGLSLLVVWMILSLAGGPAALLYFLAPSFRCYGRSGLLVVAMGAVLAPVIFHALVRGIAARRGRILLTCGVLALVAFDARMAARAFPGWPGVSAAPEWVDWLTSQPPNVRLAAFELPPEGRAPTLDWWGVQAATWLARHHHATLNGCNFALFDGDLRLLGGSYRQINPAGLRFVVSLGYETLAFHHDYIAANSWITSVAWLEPIVHDGAWQIFRARDDMPRLPARAFDDVLALGRDEAAPRHAPPGSWITGSWPVQADLVVTNVDWALLGWTDESGRPLTPPVPALFQHVFGPSIPAFVVRTPDRPGQYRLTVFDRRRQARASKSYRIVSDLAVSQREFPARRPGATSHSVIVQPALGSSDRSSIEMVLTSASQRYVQSHVFREHLSGAAQSHPGIQSRWLKAGFGGLVLRVAPVAADSNEPDDGRDIPLADDLTPAGRLNVVLPLDRLPETWCSRPLRIAPSFAGIGHAEAPAPIAELKLAVAPGAPKAEVARPETNRQSTQR
jgi:hypothetical protein